MNQIKSNRTSKERRDTCWPSIIVPASFTDDDYVKFIVNDDKNDLFCILSLNSRGFLLRLMDVREFKGKLLVDFREFYTDRSDGKKKPGKKGICFSIEEYERMKRGLNYIDRKIKKMS